MIIVKIDITVQGYLNSIRNITILIQKIKLVDIQYKRERRK